MRFAARCWRRSARAPGPTSPSACACPPTRRRSRRLDVDACAEIAARCGDGLVDFVTPRSATPPTYSGCIWIVPPPPTGRNAIATPAEAARRAAAGVPLLATTRVVDLADAERIVADGAADLVGMTRALIADPDLVGKALRGAEDETICASAATRAASATTTPALPIACTVNLQTGREGSPRPAPRPAGRTLVVGGGPAGVAAALAAARAGDEVALVERDADVGGQLRLAGHVPAHAETWARYRRRWPARPGARRRRAAAGRGGDRRDG